MKYKQCQFNITSSELEKLNRICLKLNLKQSEAIIFAVQEYVGGKLEEKLYDASNTTDFSKKTINIEEETYNYFMEEAEFRCRTLVSLIRYSINALYEREFLLNA